MHAALFDPRAGARRAPAFVGGFVRYIANTLPGFMIVLRVQRALDAAHRVHGYGAGFVNQVAHLVQAHAVLAGAGAFQPQRALHHLHVELLHGREFFRIIRVEQVAEVEVAIADVADDQYGMPDASASATLSLMLSARREIGTQVSLLWQRQPGRVLQRGEVGLVARGPQLVRSSGVLAH